MSAQLPIVFTKAFVWLTLVSCALSLPSALSRPHTTVFHGSNRGDSSPRARLEGEDVTHEALISRSLLMNVHGSVEAGTRETRATGHTNVHTLGVGPPKETPTHGRRTRVGRHQFHRAPQYPAHCHDPPHRPAQAPINWSVTQHLPSPPLGGRSCPIGCEERGVCNLWTGECACPVHHTGPACEVPLLPACDLEPGGRALDPVLWVSHLRTDRGHKVTVPGRTAQMLVFGAAPVPCACLAQMQSIPFLFEKRFEEEFLERPGGILCVEPPPGDRPWGALLEGGVGEAPFWRVVHPLVAAPSASVLDTAYYAELKARHPESRPSDVEPLPSSVASELLGRHGGALGNAIAVAPLRVCGGGRGCGDAGWCAQSTSLPDTGGEAPAECRCFPGASPLNGSCVMRPLAADAFAVQCKPPCGHGTCDGRGFCACEPGYWGLDCMLRMAPHGLPEVVPGRKGAEVVRPRIYVLDTPPVFRRGNAFQEHLERGIMEALLASPFRTADPYLADFWYVPGPPSVMEFPRVIAKLRWARDAQPFWNATVAAGISGIGARHLILMTSEHGPGEALPDTWRQDVANPQLPHQDLLPPQDLSAASFTRAWAVLRLNGNKDMPYPQ
ncbi:hypothetical protein CYMTET_14181, partial [Cymbomonas tetramitiformis]